MRWLGRYGVLDHLTPPPHETVWLSNPGRYRARVDYLLVPLVRALWAAGIPTTLSCQDWHGTGRTWLRVPAPFAERLYATVSALDPTARLSGNDLFFGMGVADSVTHALRHTTRKPGAGPPTR